MFHSTSSLVFKSPRRPNHRLTQWKHYYHSNHNTTIIVDEIVTVVLSNKIFQRKQSSQFWILEVQNNKWNALMTVQLVSGEWFIAGFQIMQESAARFFRDK